MCVGGLCGGREGDGEEEVGCVFGGRLAGRCCCFTSGGGGVVLQQEEQGGVVCEFGVEDAGVCVDGGEVER